MGLTRGLARELGRDLIRVNAVAPGYTLSDGLKAKIAAGERDPEAITATTALRKFVQPSDVAEAALVLCSDRAAAITGVTLRGRGALWALELPTAGAAAELAGALRRRGLLLLRGGPEGRVVELLPPLVIADAQLAFALAVLGEELAHLAARSS